MREHPYRSTISVKLPMFAEHLWKKPLEYYFWKVYHFNFLKQSSGNINDRSKCKIDKTIKLSWQTLLKTEKIFRFIKP